MLDQCYNHITSMLQSYLRDYSDAYNVAEETITATTENNRDRRNRFLAFKNNVPCISFISKINVSMY